MFAEAPDTEGKGDELSVLMPFKASAFQFEVILKVLRGRTTVVPGCLLT